jgi:endogenous inhibitor of DNA gyrase (YacG/DUF329 family)
MNKDQAPSVTHAPANPQRGALSAALGSAGSGNCPECRTRQKWNGTLSHSPTCSRIDLETARWYASKSEERIDKARKHAQAFAEHAQRWEGKFRVVCHENNQLRRKLLSSPNIADQRRSPE